MNTNEFLETFERYYKARIPFILVQTSERTRAIDLIRQACERLSAGGYVHTLSGGTCDLVSRRSVNEDRSVIGAIEFATQLMQQRQNVTFVLTEVDEVETDTAFSRQLLDTVILAAEKGGSIVAVTTKPIWSQLQRQGMALTLSPPDQDEMLGILLEQINAYRGTVPIEWDHQDEVRAATTLAGVTKIEAENIIATMIARGAIRKSDFAELNRAKDSIFSDISGIERVEVRSDNLQVGGLSGLQRWLERKRPLLTADLRERGIRQPRGVLLVGVPGCGKSLSAKAIAGRFEVPLYRLDLANLMGMYVGQSEGRLREALEAADRVSPCVLWIDEIEKGLGATGMDSSGVTTRMIGQFLFWLQESTARVFVVATANDVSKLPPELLRRGRFDELFFVDLPTVEERADIITLYVKRGRLDPLPIEVLAELVQMSEGFAGADLEAAVKDVVEEAFLNGDAAVTHDLYRRSFANIVPLSKTSPERIEAIRAWGRERAVPASGQPIGQVGNAPTGRRSVLIG
ncbi:AAA family ATPase [Brevundimonas sp.]|uniref:AAA family ATPase n=1 Tax=Brevundimonas sp. TaxID=1871086 RepID=UPI0028A1ACFB|nr:AAA family ATPase [Brevundimonas sp.]